MRSIMPKTESRKTPLERQAAAEKSMGKAFDLDLENTSFRVLRRNDKGQLKVLDVLPMSDVPNEDQLIIAVREKWGGGHYYVIPTSSGRKVAEGFPVELDGEPKKPKKGGDRNNVSARSGSRDEMSKELEDLRREMTEMKEKEREDRLAKKLDEILAATRDGGGRKDIVDSALSNLPQIVSGFAGLRGRQETAADLLEKLSTTVRNLEASRPEPVNQTAQIKEIADLIFDLRGQVQPPVVTGGGGSVGSVTGGIIRGVFDEIERRLGGRAGAMTQGGAGSSGGIPGASSGLSGVPERRTAGPAIENLTFAALGIDPIQKVRALMATKSDPAQVAEMIVYILDFIATFGEQGGRLLWEIQRFVNAPGEIFDYIAPHIPELRGDPEYIAALKKAVIRAIEEYLESLKSHDQRAAATPSPEPASETSLLFDQVPQRNTGQEEEESEQAEQPAREEGYETPQESEAPPATG